MITRRSFIGVAFLVVLPVLATNPEGCDQQNGPFQPAPDKPWKYPTDPPPVVDPTRKKDKRRPKPHPVPPQEPGQCNADTPLGCW